MDKLKELLGEELFNSVTEKIGDKKYLFGLEENYVTKDRFNQVNQSVSQYKEQIIDRDKQLEDLKVASKGSEELQTKLVDMEKTNEDYKTKLADSERNFAIDKTIIQSKARNSKALKALLDTEKIKYADGKLDGVDEQIKSLRESDSYLFEDDIPKGTGRTDGKTNEPKETFTKAEALKIRQGII